MSDTPTRTIGDVIGRCLRGPLRGKAQVAGDAMADQICAALNLDPAAPADRVVVLRPEQHIVTEGDNDSLNDAIDACRAFTRRVRHVPAEETT